MAFNDNSEFPRGRFSTTALTNTAQAVGTAGSGVRIADGVVVGGAAAATVIFRASGAGSEYFRLVVPVSTVVPIPRALCESGLEVLTAAAAGDVNVVITFWKAA